MWAFSDSTPEPASPVHESARGFHWSSAAFNCLSRYGKITCSIMLRSCSSAGLNVGSILLTYSTAEYRPLAASCSLQKRIRLFSIAERGGGSLLPTLDLTAVFVRHAPAHVVAAVPLEPAARVVAVNPSFSLPFGQRLASVDAEEIERVVAFRAAIVWRA